MLGMKDVFSTVTFIDKKVKFIDRALKLEYKYILGQLGMEEVES